MTVTVRALAARPKRSRRLAFQRDILQAHALKGLILPQSMASDVCITMCVQPYSALRPASLRLALSALRSMA